MNKKLDLTKIDLFLVDPDLNTRSSCKNILYNSGFRDVRLGLTLENVHEALNKTNPDLLICSADLKDGDFIDTITKIRHREVGNNPFIPIITLVDYPTPDLIQRIVESGTDSVIAKPISTTGLVSRILEFIESRKQFVLNGKYLGPIRRSDRQRGTTVPNTIIYKIQGTKYTMSELEADIKTTMMQLKLTSVDMVGTEISSHVNNLIPMIQRTGKLNVDIRQELIKLLQVTDFAADKVNGSGYEYVLELCDSIAGVASQILASKGGAPLEKHVKLLKPLSQAIQACFTGAITTTEQVKSIVSHIGAE